MDLKVFSRVRLKALPAGWDGDPETEAVPEEIGTVIAIAENGTPTVRVEDPEPGDDGLRDVPLEQIAEVLSWTN